MSPLLTSMLIPALGLAAGACSMMIYARFSPQQRIQQLQLQLGALQAEMQQYDGDFSGALSLTRRNLQLSLERLGLALGPALLSGLPVLAVLPWVGERYIAYFAAVAVAALLLKLRWKIA